MEAESKPGTAFPGTISPIPESGEQPPMTVPPADDTFRAQQQDVQRLLGRCLLRLQQYEKLMKAIVANHELTAAGSPLVSDQERRIADASSKTLGTLVGALFDSCITDEERDDEPTPDALGGTISFRLKMSLSMSVEDYDRTKHALRELVLLRNNLIHHFIDQHDLWSAAGCRGARTALIAAYDRIDQHYGQLHSWAKSLDLCRRSFAEFIQSDAFRDAVVDGIAPGGTVHWPTAGIVGALREVAAELAIDGWTPVASAAKRIKERHPDQLPTRYGCSSWRHVLHESRLFDIKRHDMDGQRTAWYRPKRDSSKIK